MITVNRLPYLVLSFLLLSLSSCEDDEPKASFMVEQDPDNKPLHATFISTSKHAESLRWQIGDYYHTAPVLEYRFNYPGTYTIALEITNEDGEVDRITQEVVIPHVNPCGDPWKEKEQTLLDQYYAGHNITPLRDSELGWQYVVVQPGNGRKIVTGHESVWVKTNYYLLDGTLALTFEGEYRELNEYNNIAVSQFRSMDEGSTFHWFLPSCYAFGMGGYLGVPPYTPVIEEIQFIKLGPEPCQC
ncbi:PKD domain-containing protein [Dawidia soli]|uniref:PKD domain-containing protein n=1 Tax=Dawidia soli TaxID=2782352 RepID=A0AAP2GJ81_9BACT|nr:hypothetical protein [Dawidia soli]MBT1688205.1 hypothetical protein [Dawidia soli]